MSKGIKKIEEEEEKKKKKKRKVKNHICEFCLTPASL